MTIIRKSHARAHTHAHRQMHTFPCLCLTEIYKCTFLQRFWKCIWMCGCVCAGGSRRAGRLGLCRVTSPHNITHTHTHTHCSSCWGLGKGRQTHRESERSWERLREGGLCVPGTTHSPNTTTVSPRPIQWRSNEHNTADPNQRAFTLQYTLHVRGFYLISLTIANQCVGNEQLGGKETK